MPAPIKLLELNGINSFHSAYGSISGKFFDKTNERDYLCGNSRTRANSEICG